MTTCHAVKKRKHSNLAFPHFQVSFSQKFNCDVKNIHHEDTLVFAYNVTKADENTFNDLVDFNAKDPYEKIETTTSHSFAVNENDNIYQNNKQ